MEHTEDGGDVKKKHPQFQKYISTKNLQGQNNDSSTQILYTGTREINTYTAAYVYLDLKKTFSSMPIVETGNVR